MDEKKCVQSLDHYEEEDKKEPIGPMAVDDVCWIVNDMQEILGNGVAKNEKNGYF